MVQKPQSINSLGVYIANNIVHETQVNTFCNKTKMVSNKLPIRTSTFIATITDY